MAKVPPGRYRLVAVEDGDGFELTPELEANIERGIEDIRAGRTVPWEAVKAEIAPSRSRADSQRLQDVSRDLYKVPVSAALQRLGEEYQAICNAKLEARGEAKGLLKILAALGLAVDEARRSQVLRLPGSRPARTLGRPGRHRAHDRRRVRPAGVAG